MFSCVSPLAWMLARVARRLRPLSHLYPGIMVTWSPENVDVAIQSLLFQIYQILLSTLLSINRQQLTVGDAHFATRATSSPLTVYLAVASIGGLFGIKTGLYKRIKSHRLIIHTLGVLIIPLWTGLSMTIWISGKAFKDSSCSYDSSFVDWLVYLCWYILYSIGFPGLQSGLSTQSSPNVALRYGLFFTPALFVIPTLFFLPILFFLFKCRSQVAAGIRAYLKGVSGPWRLVLFLTPLGWIVLLGVFVKCAWCVPVGMIL